MKRKCPSSARVLAYEKVYDAVITALHAQGMEEVLPDELDSSIFNVVMEVVDFHASHPANADPE